MKEAIGGTWIFTIVIVMIALFTAFISVSTNYARTYKVKDKIISIIEEKRGVNEASLKAINKELNRVGYNSTGRCLGADVANHILGTGKWYGFSRNSITTVYSQEDNRSNYCIRITNVNKVNVSGVSSGAPGHMPRNYYSVVVFFKLDMPVIGDIFTLQLSGETSTISMPQDDNTLFGN